VPPPGKWSPCEAVIKNTVVKKRIYLDNSRDGSSWVDTAASDGTDIQILSAVTDSGMNCPREGFATLQIDCTYDGQY